MSATRSYDDLTHFLVEYSEQRPYRGSEQLYWSNQTAQVISTDIYRVLDIFRTEHPDARVHVVRRLAPTGRVYLDLPVAVGGEQP